MRSIVIAGGTGFLGKFLAVKFRERGDRVVVISRTGGDVLWTDQQGITDALESANLLLNLAGKSVDCRYHARNKTAIMESRVRTTRMLGDAIQQCKIPPRVWINSSTATIYRHALDRPMTEKDGEIGNGFSVDVATQWEKTLFDFQLPHTRQVALRMAIVLGKGGGVMQPLTRLARMGLGGKQGSGKQMFSWIHIEDICGIIEFIMEQPALQGVLNCAAPEPVTNETLMQQLRKTLGVPVGLPAPEWLLEIGAVVIRTETELILKSRWVIPDRLLRSGYRFRYPSLQPALTDILASEPIR